jgi:hypothetical protein
MWQWPLRSSLIGSKDLKEDDRGRFETKSLKKDIYILSDRRVNCTFQLTN